MAEGWVSLHRQIREHWLWDDKPFSKGQAWVDMILRANHTEARVLIESEIIHVPEGAFFSSETSLAEEWGWSRKKVHSFVEVLMKDGMLSTKKHRKGAVFFLTNYSNFSYKGTAEAPQRNGTSTAQAPQRNTNNNDNNNNNENKEIIELFSSIPSFNGGKVENSVSEVDLNFHYKRLTERYGKKVLLEELRKQMETMNCIDDVYRFYGIRER